MAENVSNLTISTATKDLQQGKIKARKLAEGFFSAIEQNKDLNVFVTLMKKEALQMADEADERLRKKQTLGPLDGIPIAIKDNISISGVPLTAASKILEGYRPPYEATVVSKLKAAGAVILGKTNLDEFAMGSSTETSFFGPTRNPNDKSRVPGGSSGGSAAAMAANLALGALGSDTGGSIRQPASFTGVVGFKPSYGAVSRYGLLAMASSLDQIGPMAKTVEDAEILFEAIAGYDPRDSTSVNINSNSQIPNHKQIPNSNLQNIKIGIPREYFGEGLDPEIKKVIEKAIATLKGLGAEIREINLPNSKYALSCYYIIMPVEVASNLARYDGLKFGFRAKGAANLREVYFKTRAEGFGEEAKRRIMLGTYASSSGYIGKYYHKAQKVRNLIKKDFEEAFLKVDFIVGPVSPEKAFRIGEKSADPLKMYLSDIYTIAVNLAGLPAISVPCGQVSGLPVGLQIIGPQFADFEVLDLGKIYEKER